MDLLLGEKIWRLMAYFWTLVFMAFLIFNFFAQNGYEYLLPPLAALYMGILTLYVGTKEFDRWYGVHQGIHPGEIFVILWTIIVFVLFGFSFWRGSQYNVSPEIVAVYIAVLSIFALTQNSKRFFQRKKLGK